MPLAMTNSATSTMSYEGILAAGTIISAPTAIASRPITIERL
jgi:hypothetical protein